MPSHFSHRFVLVCLAALALRIWTFSSGALAAVPSSAKRKATQRTDTYQSQVVPFLSRYCFECHGNGKHKGDVRLDEWKDGAAAIGERTVWTRVMEKIQAHEMPPDEKPQPSNKERDAVAKWIEAEVFHCDCDHPDPGRVTLRRLNRAEYNNTVRDLVGVDFKPAEDFPVDDSGFGFDNIGDALSMPPVMIEKYLASARKILDAALVLDDPAKPQRKRYPVDLLEVGYNAKQRGDGWVALNSIEEDDVAVKYSVKIQGEFAVRVKAYARQDSTNAIKLTFMLGDQPMKVVEIETNQTSPKTYEAKIKSPIGSQRFRAVVRRVKDGLPEATALKWKSGPQQKGTVFLEWLELEGPLDAVPRPLPDTHRRIFSREPAPGKERETARMILESFSKRAYRRPVTGPELDRLVRLVEMAWKNGSGFEEGVGAGLQAILVSPHFLFRGELQLEPDNPKSVHRIDDFALASRLSYFLWSTMPDAELFALAERGALHRNLAKQARRMLKDRKALALVENFAGQWLQLRNLALVAPDPKQFPAFDEELRAAMRRETEMVFERIMIEDRSVLEFLSADYTYVNERLARHYGIPNVQGNEFQRVSLAGARRGGILTHASILTMTSNPTRTSPVKRGRWVLENILGTPPPPPLPDVPALSEAKEAVLSGTLRQRMEQHRANPNCASCHSRMDPIGFGLENFDGIGRWRDRDGEFPIDAAGRLSSGEAFQGPDELRTILSQKKRDQFVRCLSEKLLTYALGRGLEYYDKCAVDEIVRGLAKNGYHFSTLISQVITSSPFRMRRGDDYGARFQSGK